MASFLTGLGTSKLTGLDSVLTAAGVCAPNPDQFITDGASFITGKESVLTAASPLPCGGGCAPIPVEAGNFTLSDASAPAVILAAPAYDFTCISKGHIRIDATIDNKFVAGASNHIRPIYGIFIVPVVPPAATLFSLLPPDVQLATLVQNDHIFHTYTASATIVTPAIPGFIVFAMIPTSTGTEINPGDFDYQNFTFTATGV